MQNEELGKVIILFITFCLAALFAIGNRFFFQSLIRHMRRTDETLKDFSYQIFRYYGYTFGVVAIVFLILSYSQSVLCKMMNDSTFLEIVYYVLAFTIASILFPYAYQLILRAGKLSETEVSPSLITFIKDSCNKTVILYKWPARNRRQAQALVTDFLKIKIYLSDYLLEHFTDEEVKAIIGHELGHVRRKHLWFRRAAIWLVVLSIYFVTTLMDVYKVPIGWGFLLLFACLAAIILLVLFLWRFQERDADRYVLTLGVKPASLVSALEKLAALNDSPFKVSFIEEKFQTHPSIENRIRWIKNNDGQ